MPRRFPFTWDMALTADQKNYLWQHFQFNAEQRLKAFNFFVILSVFADGGVLTAIDRGFHPILWVLVGGFVVATSVVFLVIDIRSKELINLAVPGLIDYEAELPQNARVFTIDSGKAKLRPRYTLAFRALLAIQFIFGVGVVIFGSWRVTSL